jgi:pimeloyl-ACP methyl ester carboxylesterase
MTNRIPLMLLRGWMRDQRHWEDFPMVLESTLAESGIAASVLVHDLPGNGSRCQEDTPACIRRLTTMLIRENRQTPAVIIGLSMGGMIAAEWACQAPGQLKGICLINSSMRPYAYPWQRLRPANWPAIVSRSLQATEAREALIMSLTLGPAAQLPERLARWTLWSRQHPVSLKNVYAQLKAAATYRYPQDTAPDCPSLLLAGAHDRIVNPVCSRRLAEAWNCELSLHPEGGHDLPIEDPQWTARQISQWLMTSVLP